MSSTFELCGGMCVEFAECMWCVMRTYLLLNTRYVTLAIFVDLISYYLVVNICKLY